MGISKTLFFADRQHKMAIVAHALGHPTRLAILEFILKHHRFPSTVSNICMCFCRQEGAKIKQKALLSVAAWRRYGRNIDQSVASFVSGKDCQGC